MAALKADPQGWAAHQARKAEYDREYRKKNRERRRELARAWESNPAVKQKKREAYLRRYWKNRTRKPKKTRAQRNREYYVKNRDRVSAYHREWERNNREKVRANARDFYHRNASRLVAERLAKQKALFAEKPHLKVVARMRGRIRHVVRGIATTASCMALVGCTPDELRVHLESQFQVGMTWENYGYRGWHVDHVKPITAFDLTNEDQRKAAFHFSNLQPLWGPENSSKGNRKIYRVMEVALSA